MTDEREIDLGTISRSNNLCTERDVRQALEVTSTNPPATAFSCLVAPNASHLARMLTDDERLRLGAIALERFCTTGSLAPADYSDLLEALHDPYAFEWSPLRPFDSAPVGYGG